MKTIHSGRGAQSRPPRWADWLLELFCAPHLLEEVQGDLYERYLRDVDRMGATKANQKYGINVLSFLRPFALKRQPDIYPTTSLLSPAMLQNYVKIAFRNLARNKAYSAINIIGLSIGLAAAMLIMLYTKDEVSYDRFHANNPTIYRITSKSLTPAGIVEFQQSNTGIFPGPKFQAGVPEITSFVRYKENRKDLKHGSEVKSQSVHFADASFFSVFTFSAGKRQSKNSFTKPQVGRDFGKGCRGKLWNDRRIGQAHVL